MGCGDDAPTPAPAPATDGRYVYWTNKDAATIQRIDLDSADTVIVLSAADGLADPRGIVFDPDGHRVIWSDADKGTINSAGLNGGQVAVEKDQLSLPAGLDLADGTLYWVERNAGSLSRAALATLGDAETLATGIGQPYYVEAGPKQKWVYWTEFKSPTIHRLNLEPLGEPEPLVDGLTRVRGLQLDAAGEYLYWCDRDNPNIQRVPTDLSGQIEVLHVNLGKPHGLLLTSDHLYWTDTETGEVLKATLGSHESETLADGLDGPWGITLVEGTLQ